MSETEQSKKIKILFLEKNLSQVDLIKKYGFDKGDLSKVIRGRRRTRRIQEAVALELGLSPRDLFLK